MAEWVVLKESGNKEYQNNNYKAAIQLYTRAISR